MKANLLEKTELWINEILLEHVNLTAIAHVVAAVLQIEKEKVKVVDVRPRHITLDILQKEIPQENFFGKEKALLSAIEKIPGVTLFKESHIHSNGILGTICADVENPGAVFETVQQMTDEIQQKVSKRVLIYPTGFEVIQGLIEDTNTPYLKKVLEEKGFKVTVGKAIEDSPADVYGKLSDALNRGFGTIITTGGVGAEDKDFTVEGILQLDPQAAVNYIVKFQKGMGRHKKDGVRIGVGQVGLSRLVSLPGPHDEVRYAAPVLLQGMLENWPKEALSQALGSRLKEIWKEKAHGLHGEEGIHES